MLPHVISSVLSGLDLFARGGGGGSGGGGGGGGGGGSGGGGGGIVALFVLVGYMPTHAAGIWFRSHLINPARVIFSIATTCIFVAFWFAVAAVGLKGWGVILGILAFAGGIGGYYGWGEKAISKLTRRAQADLQQAATTDKAWNAEDLTQYVQGVFVSFQQDWSAFNVEHMKTYLSENYLAHISLMLEALKLRQRRNQVDSPRLLSTPLPTQVQDFPDNSQDNVTFAITGAADDKLIETVDSQEQQLFEDKSSFTEYWHFIRQGNTWLLDNISQQTANIMMLRSSIIEFASTNGLYYSADWGWLLLPRRGVLFKGGKFGVSDINNHTIGRYKDIIVELYTYLPNPNVQSSNREQYVIAQVALPKRYDDLIVQAREGLLSDMFQRTPKGYNKMSLEWQDFNKRYVVYATNVEQVTAFELLHPVYMEKLFTLPFKVSIEVVDNVVYLHTKDKKADYAVMYEILKAAFDEMKL
ncbi:MAG TPA: hypothetical protein VLF87_01680 [Patescibacteria group bacterium]|nr:hypothetical protein [Patescibacteria group bacterium]